MPIYWYVAVAASFGAQEKTGHKPCLQPSYSLVEDVNHVNTFGTGQNNRPQK